tara:strand:- start:39389 stop:40207 length:819 start_codon:yes stop_codon:yes gene_type:complete
MNSAHLYYQLKSVIYIALIAVLASSCNRKPELFAYTGTVVNPDNEVVVGATIQIFESPEDWLTGHNVIATMNSDKAGYFESEKIFESGDYYIFVEKLDSSNWEIRKVEQGIYPKVSIPSDANKQYVVDFNNMSLMANTNWVLTNVHREYTKPGETAIEWQSIWSSVSYCKRDNYITFNKDLTMLISEGKSICSGRQQTVIADFVPPIIFGMNSCTNLPNTSQDVKEFEYSNWPEMKAKEGRMFLSCNQSIGQMYILYKATTGLMVLEVYSRR